jgi:hypothetical protein
VPQTGAICELGPIASERTRSSEHSGLRPPPSSSQQVFLKPPPCKQATVSEREGVERETAHKKERWREERSRLDILFWDQ